MTETTLKQNLEKAIVSKNIDAVMSVLDDIFVSPATIVIDDRFVDLARQSGDRKIIKLIDAWSRKGRNSVTMRTVADAVVNIEQPGLEPGQKMPDGTVYLGQYKPKDRDGKSLSKTFNVFAAPEDLTDTIGKKQTFKYIDAVKRLKDLKDFHGYDGESYASDKKLNQALKKGIYKGGWIIPTRELLIGTQADGPIGVHIGGAVQPDNLFDHRDKGLFKGSFCMKAARDCGFSESYWSCTEDCENPALVWSASLWDGYQNWNHKDISSLSCRLVRLVPV